MSVTEEKSCSLYFLLERHSYSGSARKLLTIASSAVESEALACGAGCGASCG